jgi:hypothetical protein
MPAFQIPIAWRITDPGASGPIRRFLRATVAATVENERSEPIHVENFVLDTGATYTTVSAAWARAHRISVPSTSSTLRIRTANGVVASVVRDGELRVRFPQLPDHVFRLYCVFSEQLPPTTPPLLGLNDLLDVFRVTFDGCWSPGAEMGHISLETRN